MGSGQFDLKNDFSFGLIACQTGGQSSTALKSAATPNTATSRKIPGSCAAWQLAFLIAIELKAGDQSSPKSSI
jgi:hypothetical protein